MSSTSRPVPGVTAFRLPRSAYLVVLFLAIGVLPLAFARDGGTAASPVPVLRAALVLVPAVVAVFIARTATVVEAAGIRVRALLGSRLLRWEELRGLSVTGRSVYAVCADGAVRLPCVERHDLAAVARASGGRLPALAEVTPKSAPARRRR